MAKNLYVVCECYSKAPVVYIDQEGVCDIASCVRSPSLFLVSLFFEGLTKPIFTDSVRSAIFLKHFLNSVVCDENFVVYRLTLLRGNKVRYHLMHEVPVVDNGLISLDSLSSEFGLPLDHDFISSVKSSGFPDDNK